MVCVDICVVLLEDRVALACLAFKSAEEMASSVATFSSSDWTADFETRAYNYSPYRVVCVGTLRIHCVAHHRASYCLCTLD